MKYWAKKYLRKGCFFIIVAFILIISIWGTYKSVYFGCDIDESYAISLSYRLILGDHLFKEMWEVHQTSAIFMAPFIWLYRIVKGNTIGIVVFLRGIGCFFQFLVALGVWHSFSKYISKFQALILAAVFYNFSPKYLQVFEFCFLAYLFLMILFVCILEYLNKPKKIWMIGIGASIAGIVLAYPQTVLLFPIECFILWRILRKRETAGKVRKSLCLIIAVTMILGGCYLGLIFSNVSIGELMENVPLILSDNSHQISYKEKMCSLIQESFGIVKYILLFVFITEILQKLFKKIANDLEIKAGFLVSCIALPIILLLKKVGLQHLDLSYMIIMLSVGLLYVILAHNSNQEGGNELWGIVLLGGLVFLVVHFSSNLMLYANGGLLLPVVLMLFLMFFIQEKKNFSVSKIYKAASYIVLLGFCISFFIARATMVRFTAVQPMNVWNEYYKVEVGTLKNIYLTEKEHIQYHSKMASIQQYLTPEDTLLYLGSDAYLYFYVGNQIGTASTISTPAFDETLVTYYERYPYKMPNILVLDKYYLNLEQIEKDSKEFSDWLDENYDIENRIQEDFAEIIFRRTSE